MTAIFYVSLLSYSIWRLKAFLSKSRKHKERRERGNGVSDTLHIFEKCRDLHRRRRKQSLLLLSRPPSRDTCVRGTMTPAAARCLMGVLYFCFGGEKLCQNLKGPTRRRRRPNVTATAPSSAWRCGTEINVRFRLGSCRILFLLCGRVGSKTQ